MTVGRRVSIGFVFIITCFVVLSVGIYSRIGSILERAQNIITLRKWPQYISEIKLMEMQWMSSVSEYVGNVKAQKISANTDPTKSAIGKFLYGPERAEFEKTFGDSREILKNLEESNKKLYEIVLKMASIQRIERTGIRAYLLQTILGDHQKFLAELNSQVEREIACLTNYQLLTRSVVQSAVSMVKAIADDSSLGTVAQRQEIAKKLVKGLRYGYEGKDYVWINDLHPTMVMHPYKPELDGKDLSNFTDKKGKKLFIEFVNVAKKRGAGFVMYYWPKYAEQDSVPKISYIQLFEPWGWVLGTGVYLDERNEAIMKRAASFEKGEPFKLTVQLKEWKDYMIPEMHSWAQSLPMLAKAIPEMEKINSAMRASIGKIEEAINKLLPDDAIFEIENTIRPGLARLDTLIGAVVEEENKVRAQNEMVTKIFKEEVVPAYNKNMELLGELEKLVAKRVVSETVLADMVAKTRFFIAIASGAIVLLAILIAFLIVKSTTRSLSAIAKNMEEAVNQVATAAHEVSSTSQSFAKGASEQAASLEETASALEEMSSMATQNSHNASEANRMVQETAKAVKDAMEATSKLVNSIHDIDKASEETEKIIKTIDEIAFQTNLLALNAAVEAARAGEAGAGFAVVADEVRALAMRAAEAAKNTALLIENTRRRVQEGSNYVHLAEETFRVVETRASKITELIGEIAAASNEQAEGVTQINKAISDMDKVVQRTAASAEEAAAASEELSAQAQQLRANIKDLISLCQSGKYTEVKATKTTVAPRRPKQEQLVAPKADISKRAPLKAEPDKTKKKEVSPEEVIPLDDDFKDF
ncbi:MAG: methyl-accepting chemotaxis protein [Syntrophobacterales bacterium]|nr:methyl-accepting chemotaxis protein [Syntrophobacterales bacterium]